MKKILVCLAIMAAGLMILLGVLYHGDGQNSSLDIPDPDAAISEKADEIMAEMTLEEKVWQMFYVTLEEVEAADMSEKPVGGVIFFSHKLEDRQKTIDKISGLQETSEIDLFVGVDEEGGRASRLGKNPAMQVVKLPPMGDIGATGDTSRAFNAAIELGLDMKPLGFNLNFAPVADVITNKANTEIGNRSFSEDPKLAADMVASYVYGMEITGISTMMKHFPGHGSTQTNSHTGKSESYRTYEELKNCEFLPFEAGIEAGCDFIMMSHMTLMNATKEKVPASVSEEVINGFLRTDIGFEGIVITDAFNMEAITDLYDSGEAAIKSINAGADMILMPVDLKAAHVAVVEAVKDGTVSEERINESVKRILEIKVEKGII